MESGFAQNFEAWNPSLRRQLVGLSIGFLLAVGFFLSFATLNIWMAPVFFGLLALGIVLMLKKRSYLDTKNVILKKTTNS